MFTKQNRIKNKALRLAKKGEPLNLTRFTFDVWKILSSQATDITWKMCNCPNSVYNFILQGRETVGASESDDITFRIVTVDEEYFSWLNGRTHTQELLSEYLITIDDEKAFRLMQKNHMDYTETVVGIPLIISSDQPVGKINGILPASLANELESYYSRVFPSSDVFVLDRIIDSILFIKDNRRISYMADIYFKEEKRVTYGVYDKIEAYSDRTVVPAIIPAVIRAKEHTAVFNNARLYEDENGQILFDHTPSMMVCDKGFFEYIGKNLPDIKEAGFQNKLSWLVSPSGTLKVEMGAKIYTPMELLSLDKKTEP